MCRHDTQEFPAEPVAARAGRGFLRRCFTDWGLLAMIEDAQLVLSELLTNAIRHAGPPVVVSVSCENRVVEIAVFDGSPTLPSVRPERRDLVADLGQVLVTEAGVDAVLDERDPRLHVGEAGSVTGGRGLLLVDALVAEWGVSPRDDGKAVWVRSLAPQGWPHARGCPCSTSSKAVAQASGRSAVHRR